MYVSIFTLECVAALSVEVCVHEYCFLINLHGAWEVAWFLLGAHFWLSPHRCP